MSTLLVTGASGLLGSRLVERLAPRHRVLAMGRSLRREGCGFETVRGHFDCWEDLSRLDGEHIDAAVHLAAVTGGCLEREGLLVNVEGTRVLLQYLASHGCRKIVLAGSIAAVGFQREDFLPHTLPIPETHPCLDRDGYGLSKFLMEHVASYVSRQRPDMDLLTIRLSAADVHDTVPEGLSERGPWCAASLTYMLADDAADLFAAAVEAPLRPGCRVVNGVAERAWCRRPTVEQLRHWWGDAVDLSFYEQPRNRYASIFCPARLREELGFRPVRTLAKLETLQTG